MTSLRLVFNRFYETIIIPYPRRTIACLLIVVAFLAYKAGDFKLDASEETLLLENDQSLRYTRQIYSRYGLQDFLLIAFTPKNGDVLGDETLNQLRKLRDELTALESVSSVFSILDAPLLESPPAPINELAKNVRTLESENTDRELARKEFAGSVLYQDLLVSKDVNTTALVVYLEDDAVYSDLIKQRTRLRDKEIDIGLTRAEKEELEGVLDALVIYREKRNKKQHQYIADIRHIMDSYRGDADLYLGGVRMIADDMITFIKKDLKLFGSGVFILLVIALGTLFRRIRWVVLPLLCCVVAVISMMGLLGMFGWEVTVISSNFISLQLIITIAIVIHLIVRYRELIRLHPNATHEEIVLETVKTKIIPCLYAALTTVAGFGSLLLCNILPIINFGWMMSAGIMVSLITAFLFLPAGVLLWPKKPLPRRKYLRFSMTVFFARFTEKHGRTIFIVTGIIFVFAVTGISQLVVENSFIDYFHDSTEIHQGMKIIDQKLGGTTPLDVIVRFEAAGLPEPKSSYPEMDEAGDDLLDDFEDEFEMDETEKEKYWFTTEKMARVEAIHDYLNSLSETGKVLSLGTMLKIARKFNQGKPLNSFELAVLYTKIPEDYKILVLNPYVSIADNEVRFSVRITDSMKTLKRNVLLKRIQQDLTTRFGLKPDQVRLAGMMVLYNNMLQSLFQSQILTLGVVVLALLIMFLILFRSFKTALIALFPNLFASGSVLGFMGWAHIPLDMMTITIAAISVGIAVDNTIHYIHRFQNEIQVDRNYIQTMRRCHISIGQAMYYTSLTIIIGFSILAFSNFYPTIYFGSLTGLAMLLAMVASLTLLPRLIIWIKPFGPEGEGIID